MKQVYVLLGGVSPAIPFLGIKAGADGWITSRGLYKFGLSLAHKDSIEIKTYIWGDWETCRGDMIRDSADKKILLGYSGGGLRATYVAMSHPITIDLMVLWDPSPKWQMQPIFPNVKQVLQFHNNNPMMPSPYGMLGGGKTYQAYGIPEITKFTTEEVSMQHLLIQVNADIQNKTREAILAL